MRLEAAASARLQQRVCPSGPTQPRRHPYVRNVKYPLSPSAGKAAMFWMGGECFFSPLMLFFLWCVLCAASSRPQEPLGMMSKRKNGYLIDLRHFL